MQSFVQRIARIIRQRWARAILYALAIPLFPEYLAPVLAVVSLAAAWRSAAEEGRGISLGAIGKAVLIFICYQAITLPFAAMPLQSAESLLIWVLMFFVYLALTAVLTDRSRLTFALYALSVVAGVVGVIGCVQYFLRFVGLQTPLQLWEPIDRWVYSLFPMEVNLFVEGVRVSSTFSNPNIAAQYLVMVLPLVAYYVMKSPATFRKTLCRFALVTMVGCTAFTFCRSAYLALLFVGLIMIVTNLDHIVNIILSVLAALLLIPDAVWNRLMSIGSMDYATRERLNVWNICMELISRRPLIGYGSGLQYTWSVMLANGIKAPHAHNLILQVLVEGGIIGLLLLLFMGFRVVQSGIRLAVRKESRKLGAAFLMFAIAFCTTAMTEYNFAFPKLIGIFLMVVSFADAFCRLEFGEPRKIFSRTPLTANTEK